MSVADIREKIIADVEVGDEELLQKISDLIAQYQHSRPSWWTEERERIVMEEREKYLRGEGRSYSWEEVKEMARKGQRPDVI